MTSPALILSPTLQRGLLVDAGSCVGTQEFLQLIGLFLHTVIFRRNDNSQIHQHIQQRHLLMQ